MRFLRYGFFLCALVAVFVAAGCAEAGTTTVVDDYGITYRLNEDGRSWRASFENIATETIVVSATYDGLPVTDVVYSATAYGKEQIRAVRAVSLPEGILTIGSATFFGWYSLEEVILPDSLVSIGPNAFEDCGSLRSIHLPDGITAIETGTFEHCVELSEIHFPASLVSIGELAFSQCRALSGTVTLPDGTASIGDSAFFECSAITGFRLPASLETIGEDAFWRCTSLQSFLIDGENVHYASVDGALYDGELTELIVVFPFADTDFVLPETVLRIHRAAFANFPELASVALPEGLIAIDSYAFWDCVNLTGLTLPSSLTTIGFAAFYGCQGIQNLVIPASVTAIGAAFLADCGLLESIDVETGNAAYASQDGVLYSADMTTLVAYPGGNEATSYVVLDRVTTILQGAFDKVSLSTLFIPDSVVDIGLYCIRGEAGLTILVEADAVPATWSETWNCFSDNYVTGSVLPID